MGHVLGKVESEDWIGSGVHRSVRIPGSMPAVCPLTTVCFHFALDDMV